jgi:hypothetical protein
VVVTHQVNITALTGVVPASGEAVVVVPQLQPQPQPQPQTQTQTQTQTKAPSPDQRLLVTGRFTP